MRILPSLLLTPALLIALAASATSSTVPPFTGLSQEGFQDEDDSEGGAHLAEMEQVLSPEQLTALRAEQEEFEGLYNRFLNEYQGYQLELRELRKAGVPRAQFPPSPVMLYFPFVDTMAEAGNGPARLWLVRYSDDIVPDEADRAEYCRKYLSLLVDEHPNGQYLLDGMRDVKERRGLVGADFVLELYRKLEQNSLRPSIQAKAYFAEAEQLLAKDGREDPANLARAQEIWRILVDGYPDTKSAVYAGSHLYDALLRDMRLAWSAWLDQARELIAQGATPEELPPLEMDGFNSRMLTIAGTEHKIALRWVNRFFPSYEQASRESLSRGLALMANWMTQQFSPASPVWNEFKFGLLEFLYTTMPDGDGVLDTVQGLFDHCDRNLPENYVPVLDVLLERATDPEILYEAKLTKADSLERGTEFAQLEQALELFADVAQNAPSLEQRDRGRDMGRALSWAMPGAVHPTIVHNDAEGLTLSTLDYRGKILFLYFWTQHEKGGIEDLEWVNDFTRRNVDKGVAVLGVNIDFNSRDTFRRKTREFGIVFRNTLQQSRKSPVIDQFKVARYPTGFVIDHQGVIRGRNLGHEQVDALVAQLVAEREGESALLASRGTLRGTLRYRGQTGPLPELEISPEAAAECADLDRSDRSRLVSAEGGLANVVVTIENRGALLSGEGQTFELDGRGCRFEPHVLVVPRGAKLSLHNSDATPRHVQVSSANNKSFNAILRPDDSYPIELKAADRFQVKSPSHPWMSAWVFVSDTPFVAKSGPDGAFEVPDLPAGDYTATWWHESLGRGKSAPFSVSAGEATEIEIAVERP